MMKKLLIGFLSVMLAITAIAEETKNGKTGTDAAGAAVSLSGTVLDSASGELLVGVEVTLEGTDEKTYTDFDGQFSFNKVQPGKYKLVASYISYKKNVENLQVDAGNNELKINLETSD